MFIDMVGYTALMEEDEAYAIYLRALKRRILKHLIDKYSGTIVQYYGDGALCIFSSALYASLCALDIQRHLRSQSVPVRIGVHLGEVVHDDEGVYGHAVNVASRVESLAQAGGILISEKVLEEVKNQNGIRTSSVGSFAFKNVDRPITIYALVDHTSVNPKEMIRERWDKIVSENTHAELVQPILQNITTSLKN